MLRTILVVAIVLISFVGGCSRTSTNPPVSTLPMAPSPNDVAPLSDEPPATHNVIADVPANEATAKEGHDAQRPKFKSRWARSLSEQLDKVEGGTDADRGLIRDTLQKNDATLDRAFSNMSGRIRAANNTHNGPRRIAIPAP
jgi:hypothetical protein